MANIRLADASNQAAMNAVADLIDAGSGAGTVKIYSGTQPATGNDVVAGTLLATLTFSDPAFGDADSSGVVTAGSITDDASADATGTATWARVEDSDGNNVLDCDVGTSGATLNLNTTSITSGGAVSITAFTLTHPDGT